MTEIQADEWVVIPIPARRKTIVKIEIVSLKLVDFGVVADLSQWEDAEDDDFDREYWQEEFQGSQDLTLDLEPRPRGYSLIFWNSNYSNYRLTVAYRITYPPSGA
jgi:hypothetical protein